MCEFLGFKGNNTWSEVLKKNSKRYRSRVSAQESPCRSHYLAMTIRHFLLNRAPCCYSTYSYFKDWSFFQVPGSAIRQHSRTTERCYFATLTVHKDIVPAEGSILLNFWHFCSFFYTRSKYIYIFFSFSTVLIWLSMCEYCLLMLTHTSFPVFPLCSSHLQISPSQSHRQDLLI